MLFNLLCQNYLKPPPFYPLNFCLNILLHPLYSPRNPLDLGSLHLTHASFCLTSTTVSLHIQGFLHLSALHSNRNLQTLNSRYHTSIRYFEMFTTFQPFECHYTVSGLLRYYQYQHTKHLFLPFNVSAVNLRFPLLKTNRMVLSLMNVSSGGSDC